MQPFNIPKNPNISVQTRKQPPVHRYPAPFGGAPKANPVPTGGNLQKERNFAFPEDNSQTNFEFPGSANQRNPFEEGTPGVSEQGFFGTTQAGHQLEETPVVFSRGGNQEVHENRHEEHFFDERTQQGQNVHQQNIVQKGNAFPQAGTKKLATPNKKGIDDDEYVLMASANEDEEEQEEEPEIKRNRQIRPHVEKQGIRFEEDRGYPANLVLRKNQNPSEGVDTNLMLKIKRLELELSKEKQRADFLESEQGKLIDDNAELRRRAEELNARVDLAKKYDSNEKLAQKEEEVQRLQIEITRLTEESRIYENHLQRVSIEHNEYRRETDAAMRSLQEENQYLQNEIEQRRRDAENRDHSQAEMDKERTRVLKNQLEELKEQVQVLTDQLVLKTQAEKEMQEIIADLSRQPVHTQPPIHHPVHTQQNQTSPNQRATQETQTRKVVNETQHSQTSPQPHSHTSPQPHSHQSFEKISPVKFLTLKQANSQEITQHGQFVILPEYADQAEAQSENVPVTAEFQQPEEPQQDMSKLLASFQTEEVVPENRVEEEQAPPKDERPPMFKPPVMHAQNRGFPPQAEHPAPTSQQGGLMSGGNLMNPPKYKMPPRHVPKKPVGGFKPMGQGGSALFADEKPSPNQHEFLGAGGQNEAVDAPVENKPVHQEHHEHYVKTEEPSHHQNPTSVQEPIHSAERTQPEVVQQQEDHPPKFIPTHSPQKNTGDEPPKSFGMPKPTIPGQNMPIVNRPPLFNVHHGKPKPNKIGKNPFSEEKESGSAGLPEQTQIQKSFEQVPTQPFQQTTPVRAQNHPVPTYTKPETQAQVHQPNPYFNQEAESSEAAENFFDQLGRGSAQGQEIYQANQYIPQQEAQNQYYQQEVNTWDQGNQIQQSFGVENQIQQSFGVESQIQQSFGIESQNETHQPQTGFNAAPIRPQVGKAVPVKKKKAALPTNMFD